MGMIQFTKPAQPSNGLIPKTIGKTLAFEGNWRFNQSVLIPKCEQLAETSPGFGAGINGLELGDAGSTAHNKEEMPHMWPELKSFVSWIYTNTDVILTQWGFEYDSLVITNSWINRHKRGGWTNFHHHKNTDLVVAAYINAPAGSGDLILTDPLEPFWFGFPTDGAGYKLPARTDKVYFFAPFILHGTEPNNTDQDRWVISLNIKSFKFIKEHKNASTNGN